MRVVITGMGVLSPIGCGTDAFCDGLRNGTSGVDLIRNIDVRHLPSRMAGQIHDFDPADYLEKREIKRTDRFSQLGFAAAQLAWQSAELDSWPGVKDSIGTYLGTGIGGISTYEKTYNYLGDKTQKMKGAAYAIPRIMNNAAGSIIAEQFALCGPNLTINTACASGSNAIGMAFEAIRRGERDIMICGGTDAPIAPPVHGNLVPDAGTVQKNDTPKAASCPFDKNRDGLVMAEGAAVLILESLDSALHRGADIHGEIIGFATNSSAKDLITPNPAAQVKVMEMALDDAGVSAAEIDYVNAHGTSTGINDRVEAETIRSVFGERADHVPVSSIKSMIGHAMGASSAIDAVAMILALKYGFLPPTINYHTPDPGCDLDVVPNQSRQAPIETAISPSFAFGGNNSALVMKKMEKRNRLKAFVISLIAEELEIPATEIHEELNLRDDLGLKSLEVVSMIVDLEDNYKITIEDEEIRDLVSVGDVIENLLKKLNN